MGNNQERTMTGQRLRQRRSELAPRRALRIVLVMAMLTAGFVVATPGTAGAAVCGLQTPDNYIRHYVVEATAGGQLGIDWFVPPLCPSRGSVVEGDLLSVHGEENGVFYVQNLNTLKWGWFSGFKTQPVTNTLDQSSGREPGNQSVSSVGSPFEQNRQSTTGTSSTFNGTKQNVGSITPASSVTGASRPASSSTSAASNSVNCSWFQPTSYVANYVKTAGKSAAVKSRNHHTCKTISTIQRGDQVKVHSEKGDYRFVENLTQSKWGWVHKSVFDGSSSSSSSPAAATNGCAWVQPSSYVSNYTAYGRTTYLMRPQPNQNCPTDNRLYAGDKVTVHAHSNDWRFIENHTRGTWGWVHKDGFR